MSLEYNTYKHKSSGSHGAVSLIDKKCNSLLMDFFLNKFLIPRDNPIEHTFNEYNMIEKRYNDSDSIIYKALYQYNLIKEERIPFTRFIKGPLNSNQIKYVLRILWGFEVHGLVTEHGVIMYSQMLRCDQTDAKVNYEQILFQIELLKLMDLTHSDVKPENIMSLNFCGILVDLDNLVMRLTLGQTLSDSRFYKLVSMKVDEHYKADKFIIEGLSGGGLNIENLWAKFKTILNFLDFKDYKRQRDLDLVNDKSHKIDEIWKIRQIKHIDKKAEIRRKYGISINECYIERDGLYSCRCVFRKSGEVVCHHCFKLMNDADEIEFKDKTSLEEYVNENWINLRDFDPKVIFDMFTQLKS